MRILKNFFFTPRMIMFNLVLALFILTGCAEKKENDEMENLTTTNEDYEEAINDSPLMNGDISKLDELIKKGQEELEKGNLEAAQEYADSAESLEAKIEGYTE